jgi:hypothetical protein
LPAALFIPGALRIFSWPSPSRRGAGQRNGSDATSFCWRNDNRRERIKLLRKDGLDVIAISQPCHAWLSGQMARPSRKLAWFWSAPLVGFYSAVDDLGLDGVRLAAAAFD